MRTIRWFKDGRVDFPLTRAYEGPPPPVPPTGNAPAAHKDPVGHPLDTGQLFLVGVSDDRLTLTFQVDPKLNITDNLHNPPHAHNREAVLAGVLGQLWLQGYVDREECADHVPAG